MIVLKDINKTFKLKDKEVTAVRDVNLTIEDKEIYGIIGFSGAGKSTLVRCINLLERPTSGSVIVGGVDMLIPEGIAGTAQENRHDFSAVQSDALPDCGPEYRPAH